MTEETVRAVLRLSAVLTIFAGITLAAMSVVALAGASRAMAAAPGLRMEVHGLGEHMGVVALLTYGVVVGAGVLLFAVSDGLARRIVAPPSGARRR
jgi:hypothetical protein